MNCNALLNKRKRDKKIIEAIQKYGYTLPTKGFR